MDYIRKPTMSLLTFLANKPPLMLNGSRFAFVPPQKWPILCRVGR